jgi:hypothetical protein
MPDIHYRRLEAEELQHLEKDFVQFLAANSITAEDWRDLMLNKQEQVDHILDLFSNMVWDKILENVRFIEHRTTQEMKVYKFNKDHMELVVLRLKQAGLDLTDGKDIQAIAAGKIDLMAQNPEIFSGKKPYEEDKKREVFNLMESGGKPCKEVFWLSVMKMIGK